MEYMASAVERVAMIAALSAAMEMLLPDGPGKKSVEFIAGLTISLALAGALTGIGGG